MSERDAITRFEGVGFTDLDARDVRATLRRTAATLAVTEASAALRTTARELPMISLDLRSSGGGSVTPFDGKPRDIEILGVLGEGGMGRVFLARQHSLDRDVAIKTLREDAPAAHRAALLDEGAVTGFLEHPAIVPVHALGVDTTQRPVLVMKRVEGVSWLELIRDPSHPGWASWGGDATRRLDDHLEILKQVCNAAHFAHSRGIVHRDIKPQNVLIGRFGDVYLGDWGLAYRVDGDVEPGVCGTPAYMAPEMAVGGTIDARTDVYLLGATLHEVLSGRPKHQGANAREALASISSSEPFAYGPRVPLALAAIANRATSADPTRRFQGAAAFRDALADYARHRSSVAMAESALERLARLTTLAARADALTDEGAQAEIDRLITETRFGLVQAIEQWSDNAGATSGLAELDALVAARRARVATLERLASDLDPDVAARQRFIGQTAVVIVGVILSIVAFAKGIDFQPTGADLVKEGAVPVATFFVAAFSMRKELVRTAINRRASLCFGIAVVLILVGRIVGVEAGTPPARMLAQDGFVAATACFVTSASTFPWMAWIGAIMLGTGAACALRPGQAAFWFAAGTAVSLVAIALLSARSAARDRPHA
jgi:serine/threonine-protein kinase